VKNVSAIEHQEPGQHSSGNTVPRLTERHFISKIPPTASKSRRQRCVVCQKRGRGRTLCSGVTRVAWDSALSVFATTTPSSISKVI
jgi:hypothetical protein